MSNRDVVVVDASVVASWLLPAEDIDIPNNIIERKELCAPLLFWAAMRNILVVSERHERLSANMFSEALAILEALNVQLDSKPDGNRVAHLAKGHNLSVYDALYVELAVRLQVPSLLTLDRKVSISARREGVDVP
ncbi:MAG: type II toxin-antitoxin system VapC family toxin [Aestuariivita sp.]|nr:type II toxin-antitoxin system VapC family toxin [Aestuariivita sp.]MCY4203056.1 type II toxin-antitoxin system VapC family toxin [Aestuariivita sp.]